MKKITWPLILVVTGVIFLLNNFGLLPWAIWTTLWQFWPIILIFSGLELILPDSSWGKTLLAIFVLAVIGLVFFLSFIQLKPTLIPRQSVLKNLSYWSKKTFPKAKNQELIITNENYPNLNKRKLEINLLSGQFDLSDQKENSDLFRLKAQYQDPFGEPKITTDLDEKKNIIINFTNYQDGPLWPSRVVDKISYQGFLGKTDLLTDLDLKLAAGQANINFTDIQIDALNIEVGAGQLSLKLSQHSLPQEEVAVNLDVGQIIIYLPEEIGINLNYHLGAGKIVINEEEIRGLGKEGNFSLPSSQKQKKDQIVINSQVGAGSLIINQ